MNRRPSQLLKIGRDGVLTARTVGLRYASCDEQGIFRKGTPYAFRYFENSHLQATGIDPRGRKQ